MRRLATGILATGILATGLLAACASGGSTATGGSAAGPTRDATYYRPVARGYDVTHYDIRLAYTPKDGRIDGGTDVVTRGTWTGAVQLTSSGQPIVLGPDQRRTGGYAELGRVIAVDRWKLAHKKPGDAVRFAAIDLDDARALYRARHRELHAPQR